MSFYDDASLVFLAGGAAGKDGTAYSLKPTDGSGDFTFTRGSNLAATRVGKDGYIEKGRENLLLQSNQFLTTWNKGANTLTSGQSGYDGTNDAWLLTKFSAYGYIGQVVTNSGVLTISIYLKANTTNFGSVRISSGSGNDIRVKFDLTDGSFSYASASNGSYIVANSELIGNGWYRCSITGNMTVSSTISCSIYAGDTADSSGSIYIQDAQLEQGLVATDYIETGATTATAGLLEDEPRFDYSGGGCPALLLEPQRINIIDQSEYIASWLDINATQETNYATSPEGVQNATRVVMTSATGEHSVYDGVSITSGTQYTQSIFLKQGDGSANWRYFQFRFRYGGFGGLYGVVVDLQEGTIGYNTGLDNYGIEDYGNGWYRVWITATATTTSSNAGPVVAFNELADAYDVSIVGDTNADVLVYGAQIEAGSYPTSYIPTYGSSATRDADNPIISGAGDIININQGTLFIDATIDSDVNTEIYLMKFDGVDFNDTLYLYRTTTGRLNGVYRVGGTSYKAETSGAISGRFKVAFAYDSNNECKLYVNGSQADSSFSIPTPSVNLTAVRLGGFNDTLAKQSGLTHQSIYFPTVLSGNDSEILTGATSYSSFATMATSTALNYTIYE